MTQLDPLTSQIPFDDLYQALAKHKLSKWQQPLAQAVHEHFYPRKFGRLPFWQEALDSLPDLKTPMKIDQAILHMGVEDHLNQQALHELTAQLMQMHPWRKGPFALANCFIDSEWRCDHKWDRLIDKIASLKGRKVLDVGCGNGYHMWRAYAEGAKFVLGVDPTALFHMQFKVIKHYLADTDVYHLPITLEQMPAEMSCFETVFSMGVLYHRKAPFEHLYELKSMLKNKGELIIETLVVEGDQMTVLVPPDRYAMMNNVWVLPSVEALCLWLNKVGFIEVEVIDVSPTTEQEQRKTKWMTNYSLSDFLDPNNKTLTVEGHQAPTRAIIKATKP